MKIHNERRKGHINDLYIQDMWFFMMVMIIKEKIDIIKLSEGVLNAKGRKI